MSSTKQKLEAIWDKLSVKARQWLLCGKITIREAQLLTARLDQIGPEVQELLDRQRARALYISGLRVGCEDITSFDDLVQDVLAWEQINPIATDIFLNGDFTHEQMRMAACLQMGRRSARMFSLINYPERVKERRELARRRRRMHATQRRMSRTQLCGPGERSRWPSYQAGSVWCPA